MIILRQSHNKSSVDDGADRCLKHNMGVSGDRLQESQLWIRFKRGDQEAFEYIYKRYYSVLYGYGRKLFPNSNDLDDCIQELFLKLWKKRENLSEVVSVKAYLMKSFRRMGLDRIKQSRKYTQGLEQDQFEVALSMEDMVISDEMGEEQKANLRRSVEKLSKRQKEIIYLKFYEGLSYEEIESIAQINYQTIRNCVYEAVKVLKKDLLSLSFILLPGMEVLI